MTESDLYGLALCLLLGGIPAIVLEWWENRFNPVAGKKKKATYWKEREGTHFTQKEKAAIYRRAGGRCENSKCRVRLVLSESERNSFDYFLFLFFRTKRQIGQIDHIIPRDYGGPGDVWNGQLLCPGCNRTKGNAFGDKAFMLLKQRRERVFKPGKVNKK